MVQAIVFLPLIGAVLAGLISIFGAHARNPSGDEVEHMTMRMAREPTRPLPMTIMRTTITATTITPSNRRQQVRARPS